MAFRVYGTGGKIEEREKKSSSYDVSGMQMKRFGAAIARSKSTRDMPDHIRPNLGFLSFIFSRLFFPYSLSIQAVASYWYFNSLFLNQMKWKTVDGVTVGASRSPHFKTDMDQPFWTFNSVVIRYRARQLLLRGPHSPSLFPTNSLVIHRDLCHAHRSFRPSSSVDKTLSLCYFFSLWISEIQSNRKYKR